MIPSLLADGLGFAFSEDAPTLFRDVNLEIYPGEIVAIIGPSGSGKTTLCHCLAGVIPLIRRGTVTGRVLLGGTPVSQMRPADIASRLGIVFQDPDAGLFFPVVEDEIAFGPENLCIPPGTIRRRISSSLEAVGISHLRRRNPHNLSGGEKQLVATASVLSLEPEILILDEAMSGLDGRGKTMMRELVVMLRGMGKAVLMVEHDPENLDEADRILILHDGALSPFDGNWDGFPEPGR